MRDILYYDQMRISLSDKRFHRDDIGYTVIVHHEHDRDRICANIDPGCIRVPVDQVSQMLRVRTQVGIQSVILYIPSPFRKWKYHRIAAQCGNKKCP